LNFSQGLIDSTSLSEIFGKSGIPAPEFIIKRASVSSHSFSQIDNRDLADVYLSSNFNEPSSADIASAVKTFIIDGSLQARGKAKTNNASVSATMQSSAPANPFAASAAGGGASTALGGGGSVSIATGPGNSRHHTHPLAPCSERRR
jgi:hypothetical protein